MAEGPCSLLPPETAEITGKLLSSNVFFWKGKSLGNQFIISYGFSYFGLSFKTYVLVNIELYYSGNEIKATQNCFVCSLDECIGMITL